MRKTAGTIASSQNFYERPASFNSVRSATVTNSQDFNQIMTKQLRVLILESAQYDEIKVVQRIEQRDNKFEIGKQYDSLSQAQKQFIQTSPSDEQLLQESDYILERKVKISNNLKAEIENINNLIPSPDVKIDYVAFKQKQGKRLIQHFKKLFKGSTRIEEQPDQVLAEFLTIYKEQLNQYHQDLISDHMLKQRLKSGSSVLAPHTLNILGAQRRSVRPTISPSDEKVLLEEKRMELHNLELLVLKIVIAVERINYYTMGIILPRDQNLSLIPFFPQTKDSVYDLQSCLKIQTLIKQQIERQEQFERQISPFSIIQENERIRYTMHQQPTLSEYFSRSAQDLKEKYDFREWFKTKQHIDRCADKAFKIWHEFTEDKETKGLCSNIKVNLFVQVKQLVKQFEALNHRVTLQLFTDHRLQCQQTEVTNAENSWLFTEIAFGSSLLFEDLVLVIKVYKNYDLPFREIHRKQKVNSKTDEPMRIQILKAYQVINLSDKFFEEKMKDGKPLEATEVIKFVSYDQKYTLDLDYDRILKELRDGEFTGQIDEELSAKLNLKLQFTFMSTINLNQLALRLDRSVIIRRLEFWEKMVRPPPKDQIVLKERDPQAIFQREMEELNLKDLLKTETLNDLKVNINTVQVDKSKIGDYSIYRVQCFLVSNDSNARTSINLKFLEHMYTTGNSNKKFEESHQTQLATMKKGVCNFRSEFNVRVPITLKSKDLVNYKLVFVVYVSQDSEKKIKKISEQMVEENPLRFTFVPYYFARKTLWDKTTNCLVGGNSNREDYLQLMRFNPSKSLQEQLDTNTQEQVPNTFININLKLSSQQYSVNPKVNKLIEPIPEDPIVDIIDTVGQLSNNELLTYHTRIMYSLLHLYNNTQLERSRDSFDAIILIFKRFQTKEMQPYKGLIQDYSERWRGDRESDKKLLTRLIGMLERIPMSIESVQQRILEQKIDTEIQGIEQKITHLPPLLTLICRLFSREFQQQYATIRENIQKHFNSLMDHDLCLYRPDLVENAQSGPKKSMCSKPATVVQQLVEDVKALQIKFQQKAQEVIKEEADDDEEDSEANQGMDNLLNGTADDFTNRVSQMQYNRFSTNLAGLDTTNLSSASDVQLQLLKRSVNELRHFQQEFCKNIRSVILNISKHLHTDLSIVKDEPGFCNQVNRIIELQKLGYSEERQKELEVLIAEVNEPYRRNIQTFPQKANERLRAYIYRQKEMKMIFWRTLQENLLVLINFIDRKFVLSLFDEKLLLKKVEPALDKIVENIIPKFEIATKTYGAFYKAQLEYTSQNAKDKIGEIRSKFESEVKEATSRSKVMREVENQEIEKQVQAKVSMLSDLIASEVYILLPSDSLEKQKPLNPDLDDEHHNEETESIQEVLATRISLSVYNHTKQYKSQHKIDKTDSKVKDTTQSEMQYMFLYKMSVFEKNYFDNVSSQAKLAANIEYEERPSHFSMVLNDGMEPRNHGSLMPGQGYPSYRPVTELDDFDTEILNGLSSTQKTFKHSISEEESKDQPNQNTKTEIQRPSSGKLVNTQDKTENSIEEPSSATTGKGKLMQSLDDIRPKTKPVITQAIAMNDIMQMGLGAQKELTNFKDREYAFFNQFEQGSDRRLCLFLNEMEDALSKYWELKDGSSNLSLQELKEMKGQYISLFSVLSLQHLFNLSQNAFKILYSKRPGCLDRLVKQVRLTITVLEFGDDEFFFKIKKLQVVDQFCKNVIEVLCEPQNKKYIADLSDKYTYKSIVSQVWVLQQTLLAEQAQVLYEYTGMGFVMKVDNPYQKQNIADFTAKLHNHYKTQSHLWLNYKDMGDMILPDEQIDLYAGIQGRIIKILQADLEDSSVELIQSTKLSFVLKPLAQMFVQIDELTFRTTGELSYRMYAQIERLLKEFVDFYATGSFGKKGDVSRNHIIQKNKKRQICDYFCEEYAAFTSLDFKDLKFKEAIQARVQEITQLKKLYLHVIEYEKLVNSKQQGNLLAQLIAYHDLMLELQDKGLTVSFQNNIKLKYNQMIRNIDMALQGAYEKEKKQADEDPDNYICQKQPSQYINQMKEVDAFMHYEDYTTYKSALDKGLLASLGNAHNVKTLETIIDKAVSLLVPNRDQPKSNSNPPNQFFDVALKLLSDKRMLQETNYDFSSIVRTLKDQTNQYQMYEKFEQKAVYCNYYRIKIDSFLPEDVREDNRLFVYRTPSGYNQEFIKHDLGVLLGSDKVTYSKECDVKPLTPLTYEVRQKYAIPPNTKNLSETPVEINLLCPQKFRTYFKQNFKKQFFVEQCPSQDPAGFDEEYVITIYEVKKTFPTMTMIQQVYRNYEKRIPRVKIELWTVQMVLLEIQQVLRSGNVRADPSQQKSQQQGESVTLEDIVKKYITNDDVGGGLPKMVDLFFNESLARDFNDLDNYELKRAYLDLFKELEKWLSELQKVVEMFSTENTEMTKLAQERLEDRSKLLNERKHLYKLQMLQENF